MSSDHFMSLWVGPVAPVNPLRQNRLQPRGPGKLQGPIMIAPGIKAYYSQSAYKGEAGGRGTMKFVDKGHLLQITVVNASGNTLSGLEAVAKRPRRTCRRNRPAGRAGGGITRSSDRRLWFGPVSVES